MIPRYTNPEVGKLWTESFKKKRWLDVELAVLWARGELGEISKEIYPLAKKVKVTRKVLKRADEIEKIKDHDLIAFILAVIELLPEQARRFFHAGLTSFDTEDTALSLILGKSLDIIIAKLNHLRSVLKNRAGEHRDTIMIGRTHFIHAEPITFGWKLLTWLDVVDRHISNIKLVQDEVKVGKISGAVGCYVINPRIEELACRYLGLRPAKTSTQVLSRDLLVRYTGALVAMANSLDRFATEIRHLAGTDIGEVAEFKRAGASGSSAMPGKSLLRNPIKSENVGGLAKMMRGYLLTSLECEILWNERSLDNSAPERIYLPDVTILADFMLYRFTSTIEKLEVDSDQMLRNVWKTGGVVFAQRVMMALVDKGMPRDEAYDLLEKLALSVKRGVFQTEDGKTFEELVYSSPEIASLLTRKEVDSCFDPAQSLTYIDAIFKRFGL